MTKTKLSPLDLSKIRTLTSAQMLEQQPEVVEKAISLGRSQTDILLLLGLSPTNTRARNNIRNFAENLGLSLPKYAPVYGTVKTHLDREEALSRLVKSDKYLGTFLRKLVLKFDLLPYHCFTIGCMIQTPSWNQKTLTLDLDHINGDNTDNRIDNLRFLCPNCHSQTESYKGKNKRPSRAEKKITPASTVKLSSLSKEEKVAFLERLPDRESLLSELQQIRIPAFLEKYCISRKALKEIIGNERYLSKQEYVGLAGLTANRTVSGYPPLPELIERVSTEGYESVSRELGVSGNAIRKHIGRLNGSYPKTRSRLKAERNSAA